MAKKRILREPSGSTARKGPGKSKPQFAAPAPKRHKRPFTKVHMNMLTSQLDDLKSVSNQTGLAMAVLLRFALAHWQGHRDPSNPIQFRCEMDPHRFPEKEPGVPHYPPIALTKRASPPPAGQPDHRPDKRRPWRVPASETQNGEPLDIPHDQMVKFSRLLEKDFAKYPDSTSDDQARRLASRMGWSPLEAMSAMSGLDEGYLDADGDEEDEDEDA
jgi:hypothetical protein